MLDDDENRSVEDCLITDVDHIGDMGLIYDDLGGNWIDDGDILKEQWTPGMGVVAIKYCSDEDNKDFKSIQVVVGNDEEEIKLQRHGNFGGKCRMWRLQPDDYIREIQYTWDISIIGG